MRKLSSRLNSCSPPVKQKLSIVVVALSITILVELANRAKWESTGVTSKKNFNNNKSISSYNKSSVSSGGGGGGGGSCSSSSSSSSRGTDKIYTTTTNKQPDGK
jgi:hypothetical protein